jgi:hypothetical protein
MSEEENVQPEAIEEVVEETPEVKEEVEETPKVEEEVETPEVKEEKPKPKRKYTRRKKKSTPKVEEEVKPEPEVEEVKAEETPEPEVEEVKAEETPEPVKEEKPKPVAKPKHEYEAFWNEVGRVLHRKGYSKVGVYRRAIRAYGADFDKSKFDSYVRNNNITQVQALVEAVWTSQK